MTLDEAIKHCEEKEREQALNGCFACAEEHKQLAEWLKDYKRLLEKRTQGDLISREWLKDAFDNLCCHDCKNCRNFRNEDSFYKCNLLENAPAVNTVGLEKQYFIKGFKEGCEHGKRCYERPQGKCKTCKHRDPEDKKCDCGGIERQGCPFPVSDDYYCKYYERGEEE